MSEKNEINKARYPNDISRHERPGTKQLKPDNEGAEATNPELSLEMSETEKVKDNKKGARTGRNFADLDSSYMHECVYV